MEKDISQNRRSGLNAPRNQCLAIGIDLQRRMAVGCSAFSVPNASRRRHRSSRFGVPLSRAESTFDGVNFMMHGRVLPHSEAASIGANSSIGASVERREADFPSALSTGHKLRTEAKR